MGMDDLEHIVQAYAKSFSGLVAIFLVFGSTLKAIEYRFLFALRYAYSLVVHLNIYIVVVLEGRNADVDLFFRVFGGVVYQVADSFLQIFLVCSHSRYLQLGGYMNGLGRLGFVFLGHILYHGLQFYYSLLDIQLAMFQFRDGEQSVDECQ